MDILLIGLLGFVSLFIAITFSPFVAFLSVYVPSLLLLPEYSFKLSGLIPITFHRMALFPIVLIAGFNVLRRWRIKLLDLLVISYLLIIFIAESNSLGVYQGVFYLGILVCDIFLPYMVAQHFLNERSNDVRFLKRFVFCVFISIIISFWQMKMTVNPFLILDPIFNRQFGFAIPYIRFGLSRIQGPYIVNIIFGVVIAFTLLLNDWLIKNNYWENRFKFLIDLAIKKGWIIASILFFGLAMTVSQGAIAAFLSSLVFLRIGYRKKIKQVFYLRLFLIILAAAVVYEGSELYKNLSPFAESSEFSGSVAYRAQLFDSYKDLLYEKPLLGWGSYDTPRVSQGSIDNAYIDIWFHSGYLAMVLFISLFLFSMYRLVKKGFSDNILTVDRAFCFTLFSVFLCLLLSFMFVYFGTQLVPIFFILMGMTRSFIYSDNET